MQRQHCSGASCTGTLFPKLWPQLQLCFSLESFPQIITYTDFPCLMAIMERDTNITAVISSNSSRLFHLTLYEMEINLKHFRKYLEYSSTCAASNIRGHLRSLPRCVQPGEVRGMVEVLPSTRACAARLPYKQAQRSSNPTRRAFPLTGTSELEMQILWNSLGNYSGKCFRRSN